jgi:hypothetical protein
MAMAVISFDFDVDSVERCIGTLGAKYVKIKGSGGGVVSKQRAEK